MTAPIFSIIHASARPDKWRASYEAWWSACDDPTSIEYILAIDEGWGFWIGDPPAVNERTAISWSSGKRGAITAWNDAARLSTGHIIIANSDDMRPPQSWDTELLKVCPDLDTEFVVEVSSGALADNRRLMVIYILSRARYERLGYVANPEYKALWVDNEFTDHARQDGIVIDARHLEFRHLHPHSGEGQWDEVYASGNTPESWQQGMTLYNRRKAEGFPIGTR